MLSDQKQKAIINAAIKRFAHFGVAKTTMAEIAADLNISKPSLYYYFPDKLNLYAEVFKTITNSGSTEYEDTIAKEDDPFKAILLFLERRTEFIIKYHNILSYLRSFSRTALPAELQQVFAQLKKREVKQVTSIIEKGVQSGLFKINDARKTTELFFDFLEGFRMATLAHNAEVFPDKKQFQAILRKEKEFATIFFNGLTKKS